MSATLPALQQKALEASDAFCKRYVKARSGKHAPKAPGKDLPVCPKQETGDEA